MQHLHRVLLSLCCPAHFLLGSAENIHPLAALIVLKVLLEKVFLKKTSALHLWQLERTTWMHLA